MTEIDGRPLYSEEGHLLPDLSHIELRHEPTPEMDEELLVVDEHVRPPSRRADGTP